MRTGIRAFEPADQPAVTEFALRADQRRAVEAACQDENLTAWVSEAASAVDPAYQRRGIATALTEHALRWFTENGLTLAMVETGGDPGHAPARRTYERAGFTQLPIARYFRRLDR
ncbi:GNAT family N-acetyltransferase [Amycolatopsis albispora]|uniref:N-acetyltransferase domain-containing protein n=1 Tax=Amycolatopsis albispora TaxID=1804986 RepID=A0A344L4G0_9PSEU|nr:GNAT family N-acetyltransferase [Amycolatopsis albispora]AXB42934.1 hypothetical protein A4R43_10585 [Amycolatopsis albispora]